jgi:hypothetical protein
VILGYPSCRPFRRSNSLDGWKTIRIGKIAGFVISQIRIDVWFLKIDLVDTAFAIVVGRTSSQVAAKN